MSQIFSGSVRLSGVTIIYSWHRGSLVSYYTGARTITLISYLRNKKLDVIISENNSPLNDNMSHNYNCMKAEAKHFVMSNKLFVLYTRNLFNFPS